MPLLDMRNAKGEKVAWFKIGVKIILVIYFQVHIAHTLQQDRAEEANTHRKGKTP